MSVAEPNAHEDRRLAALDGLLYADGFGCALTLEELWRYSAVPVERDELRRLLDDDPDPANARRPVGRPLQPGRTRGTAR